MKKYLLYFVVILLLLFGAVGSINYFADPMLLYRLQGGGKEQLSRVDQFQHMRLYKPWHVRQRKPNAIIIGSSRSGTLNPRYTDWGQLDPYNLSVPGVTLYELNRLVRHAQATRPLKKLTFGLDYDALVRPEPVYRPGFVPSRMALTAADFNSASYIKQGLRDLLSTLFSTKTLADSIVAVAGAGPGIREFYPNGAWEGLGRRLTGRGGYIYVANFTAKYWQTMELDTTPALAVLEELLEFCYQNNIETRFFLTPTHVFTVDLWFHLSSESLWRETHQAVVAVNSRAAKKYQREPFQIWGFGNEPGVVDEPIYRSRDIEKAWFNDGVHYRPKLAKRILAAIWEPDTGFGQRLEDDNIDYYLDSILALHRDFMHANQDSVEQIYQKMDLQR